MPFATTPVPTFPDVPFNNGVPPVFRAPTKPVFATELLIADAITILRNFLPAEWGIFMQDSGFPAIVPDSVVAVDVRKEWRISDYPVERGGFQSYNKVETPGDVRVRMAVSGAISRGPFIAAVAEMVAALDPLVVVTPDAIYPSMNAVHYDYRREQRSGASLLIIDIWLEEIRVTAQTQFTDTKSPEGAPPVSQGVVQGTAPTPAQTKAMVTSSAKPLLSKFEPAKIVV